MEVEVDTNPDYIDVDVTVHFGDQKIKVPQLMEAMKEGNRPSVFSPLGASTTHGFPAAVAPCNRQKPIRFRIPSPCVVRRST